MRVKDNSKDEINRTLAALPETELLTVRLYSTELPHVVATRLKGTITDVHMGYLRDLTDDAAPAAGVFLDWIPDQNGIRIRGITGLTAGKNYEIRLRIYAQSTVR